MEALTVHKNAIAAALSFGLPSRFIGVLDRICSTRSGCASAWAP